MEGKLYITPLITTLYQNIFAFQLHILVCIFYLIAYSFNFIYLHLPYSLYNQL